MQTLLDRDGGALAALGGEQPYREALLMLGKVNRANLSTFAALGMLAYLDLSQWERDSGAPIIDTQYAELLNIDLDRLRET